jgi:hypothetical protein
VIASDIGGVVIGNLAFLKARIPDAGATAVFTRSALDLEARGRYAPYEIAPQCSNRRKFHRVLPLVIRGLYYGAVAWKHPLPLRAA